MTYELYDHNKCKLEIISSLNLFVVDFLFLKGSGLFFYIDKVPFCPTYEGLQQIWQSPTLALLSFLSKSALITANLFNVFLT